MAHPSETASHAARFERGMTPAPLEGEEDKESVVGLLERITYRNEENGFVIARLQSETELLTVKGVLGNVREGETVKVWGTWEDHPTYGHQFSVSSFVLMDPATLAGIEKYLAANLSGVGEVLARRIVKCFGRDTFKVIDETPEKLLEVPKFPAKILDAVKVGWEENRVKREIMVFLLSVGVSAGFSELIFTTYGIASVEALKDNPYRLATDVRGIGFRRADVIASNLGIAQDSPRRVEAGTLFALDESSSEGHTGLPRPELERRAATLLEVPPELVTQAVDALLGDGSLKALTAAAGQPEPGSAPQAAPAADQRLLFRIRYHRAEGRIVKYLSRLCTSAAFTSFRAIPEKVAELERDSGLYLNAEQRGAVELALAQKGLIITGGPGTGKTTIVRFILGLVADSLPDVALAAPTGKAAKRLTETTGRPAKTIHRLLEAGPKGFGRNEDLPIEAELVIVDESSMIDTTLMAALLAALPEHARLVLVGDVDQLPSVGPGRVLGDLIDSGRLPVARLETVFRQEQAGRITANAHAIRRGQLPELTHPSGEALSDFYFINEREPERIVEKLRVMLLERIPEAFGMDPLTEVQVLSPMHRGITGTRNLNALLQQWLNPQGEPIGIGDPPYRIGDRVMQTRNDYEKDVFNGDMGEISDYDEQGGKVGIEFEGRRVAYQRKELDQITLGYAISVHKSQGSEYPAVVFPLTTHHSIMLQRNLLYTALTRGRRLVVIIGTEQAMSMAVRNARPVVRHTGLGIRLRDGWEDGSEERSSDRSGDSSEDAAGDGAPQHGEAEGSTADHGNGALEADA